MVCMQSVSTCKGAESFVASFSSSCLSPLDELLSHLISEGRCRAFSFSVQY